MHLRFLGALVAASSFTVAIAQSPTAASTSAAQAGSPFGFLADFADKDFIGCYKGIVVENDIMGEWNGHQCITPVAIRWTKPGEELTFFTHGGYFDVLFRRSGHGVNAVFKDGSAFPVTLGNTGEIAFQVGDQRWVYTVEAGKLRWRTTVQKSGGRLKTYGDYVFHAPFPEARGAKFMNELAAQHPLAKATPKMASNAASVEAAPNMKYPKTDEAILAAWGPFSKLAGSTWGDPTGGSASKYEWVERGRKLRATPLFFDPGFSAIIDYELVGYGKIAYLIGETRETMQLEADGSYTNTYGYSHSYTMKGDTVAITGATSSTMLRVPPEMEAAAAAKMKSAALAFKAKLAADRRRAEEENRRFEAEMEAENRAWAEQNSADSYSGPNLYDVLSGMAEAAAAAADASSAELADTIARATSQGSASGGSSSSGGFLTVEDGSEAAAREAEREAAERARMAQAKADREAEDARRAAAQQAEDARLKAEQAARDASSTAPEWCRKGYVSPDGATARCK